MQRKVGKLDSKLDLSLINKAGDYLDLEQSEYSSIPVSWYTLENRPIFRNDKGILEEIDLTGENTCKNPAFREWASKWVKSYAALHGKKCQQDWFRWLKGKDKF